MNHEEFVRLVLSMRTAQKAYFKERSGDNLKIAKDLERAVDDTIKKMQSKDTQKTMW